MKSITGILSTTCIMLVLAAPAFPQDTGTITGTVRDQSGGVVPGVQITIVQTETNFVTNALTTEDGRYRVQSLLTGPYRLTFESSGFKRLVREGVALRTGDVLPVDGTLEIGALSDQVEVSAEATMLQTETSSSGTVTEGETLYKMPLFQHQITTTMALMPGVSGSTSGASNYSMSTYNVAGQRSSATAMFEDGTFGVDPQASSTSIRPIGNSVDEVKVLTSSLSAEYGHTGGGVMTVVKKSGTNDFHGQASAYGRGRSMTHRQYFAKYRSTDPQPGAPNGVPYLFFQPDMNVSGPVYIPGVYDGRNKSFFSYSFLKFVEKKGDSYTSMTPTREQLAGDFTFGGKGNVLYDPATTRQLADGTWIRDPFPTKALPTSRIDPVAQKIMQLDPFLPPNTAGSFSSTGPVSNYTWLSQSRGFKSSHSGRFDHQFNSKTRAFFSATLNDDSGNPRPSNIRLDDISGSFALTPTVSQSYSTGVSYVISPTALNDVRGGYYRIHSERLVPSFGKDWGSKLGIPNISPLLMPAFSASTAGGGLSTTAPLSSMYGLNVSNGPSYNIRESISFRDDFSKMVGAHSLKIGYELLSFRGNYWQLGQPSGAFDFTNMTAGLQPNGQPLPNTGNDFAAFLLGAVRQATFSTYTTTWVPRDRIHSLYIQDDWKATPNLTLNMGLRWSTESPYHTTHGMQSNFDPDATDPLTGKKGAIVHPTGYLSDRQLTNFQPRFGVAWHPWSRWVFRGGFGWNTIDMRWPNSLQQFDEYQALSVQERLSGDPRPLFQLSQGPAPATYNIGSNGAAVYVGKNYGSRNVWWIVPDLHPAYALNWNTTIELQMSKHNLFRLTYQGSAGVGLIESWNVNVFPTSFGANDPALRAKAFAAEQNYLPYPQFGQVRQMSNSGHSTYHAGTIQYEKRMSHGLVVGSFYTFSKTLSQCDSETGTCTGRMPVENRRLEKGRAGFDQNHRLVANANYALPLGAGKRFLNKGGVWNLIFGGYEISWVQTFASGNPMSFGFANSPNNYFSTNIGARYPDLVGARPQMRSGWRDLGPDRFNQANSNAVFSINSYAYPAAFTVGNAGRNIVTGPGVRYSNLSAKKSFYVTEKLKAMIRWDFQNTFHNYGFNAPSTSVDFKNPNLFGKLTSDATTTYLAGQPLMMLTVQLSW